LQGKDYSQKAITEISFLKPLSCSVKLYNDDPESLIKNAGKPKAVIPN